MVYTFRPKLRLHDSNQLLRNIFHFHILGHMYVCSAYQLSPFLYLCAPI